MPLDRRQVNDTATHIENVLESIDAGELEATAAQIAGLEGAAMALRTVSDPASGS